MTVRCTRNAKSLQQLFACLHFRWNRSSHCGIAFLADASVFTMLLLLFVGGLPASAQEPAAASGRVQTSTSDLFVVSGMVLDPSGASISGAEVTLSAGNGEAPRSRTTGVEGKFYFEDVPPGNYEIQVRQENFATFTTRLQIKSRAPAPLHIVLPLAQVHQEVTVVVPTNQLTTEPANNSDAITLDPQQLQALPVMNNDVVAAATNMMNTAGIGPRGVTVLVDGLPATDSTIPASSIQEVKINRDPYSAEYSAPGGARIEIRTKSGSRHYHGSIFSDFRDYPLDARNAFATVKPPESHYMLDGTFTGPVGGSKNTSFLASFYKRDDHLEPVVYALTPSGTVSENVSTPKKTTFVSAGIYHKIGQKNTLSLRYGYYDWSYLGEGVGGLTLPEAGYNTLSHGHRLYLSDRAILNSHLVNELSAQVGTSDSTTSSAQPGMPSVVVLGAFTGGGAQVDSYQSRNNFEVNDVLLWSHGNHLIKAGINIPSFNRYGLEDYSNFGGTFQFSSLQDYLQGVPFSFTQQQGNGRLIYWQEEMGAFVQDNVRLRPNLSMALGLRYDWQNYVSNPNNFAPRFSFAYAPGKNGKIVLRGGAGIFYQTTGRTAIADMLRFNGIRLQQFVLTNPAYPDPFVGGGIAATVPSSIVQFAPNLRLPYTVQYSMGMEWQLTKSASVAANYVGIQGFDLFMSRDINASLPPLYDVRPDPSIGTLRQIESSGRLESNALNLTFRTKASRFFTGAVQYTYSRSYDNTGGINWFPANQYDLTGEWGRSNRDARHELRLYGTLNFTKLFELGLILSARSGQPYTETTGTDLFGTTFANARPTGVPRNSLQGPGSVGLDVRVTREFRFFKSPSKNDSEGINVRIGLDAFNVLNHVNFEQPVGNLSSPLFGLPVSAGPGRRLQLSLGLEF